MTQVSRATWASSLTTLINDNTAGEISAADVRSILNDLEDSVAWHDEAEGVDADILKADTADTLTAGFDTTDHNGGTQSSGTYTPDPADGNSQYIVNGGAFTLAPPASSTTIVLHITNNGSAGAITTSGFTKKIGADFTTTDADEFLCTMTRANGVSVLYVEALQ